MKLKEDVTKIQGLRRVVGKRGKASSNNQDCEHESKLKKNKEEKKKIKKVLKKEKKRKKKRKIILEKKRKKRAMELEGSFEICNREKLFKIIYNKIKII